MVASEYSGNEEPRLKKGSWGPEESALLFACVEKYGVKNWSQVAEKSGLSRSGKSCRLRWQNYLKPGLNRAPFTGEEEELIYRLHLSMGNKWAKIATALPGRTDNDIKNHWNTHMKTKLKRAGRDPASRASLSDEEIAAIFRTGNDASTAPTSETCKSRKKKPVGKSCRSSAPPPAPKIPLESSSSNEEALLDGNLEEIFLLLSIPEGSNPKLEDLDLDSENLDMPCEDWKPVAETCNVGAPVPCIPEGSHEAVKEPSEISASFPSITEEMSSDLSYGAYLTPEVSSSNPFAQYYFNEEAIFPELKEDVQTCGFDGLDYSLLHDDKMDIDNLETIEDHGWTFKVSPEKAALATTIPDLNEDSQFYFVSTLQMCE